MSFDEGSVFFQSDVSQITEWLQLETDILKPQRTRARSQSEYDINSHTKNVLQHCLHSNQSYENLKNTSKLINATPGAKFHVPTTMHRIKKFFCPILEATFHIWCACCKCYSPATSAIGECQSCSMKLKRAKTNYFVNLPFEAQFKKSIGDNFDEILSYRRNFLENSDTIRDVHDGIQFKHAQKMYPSSIVLPLTVNTDGARMFNSSNKSIWPIQIYQNYLHPSIRYIPSNILVVGLYSGKPDMQHFFKPFLKELKRIVEDGGITIHRNGENFIFLPIITMFTADLPAKAAVQGIKGHSGYGACSFCLHPGILVKPSQKSKSVVRYLRKDDVPLRTHDDILKIYKKLKYEPINGIKTISCMVAAPQFDLVKGFSIDYLHFGLLGIMKKLLDLWLSPKNNAKPYYITKVKQNVLNRRILDIKPTAEITRHPRSIFERAEYKGNEYRTLLLYYLRFCLVDLLPMRFINHFQLLSSSIYMLLKSSITTENLSLAEARLKQFANEYEALYGQENVTMNLHLCRHVVESVKNLGPLWAQSAFGFETNNGVLVRSNEGKRDYLQQICWKYITKFTLQDTQSDRRKINHIDIGGKILMDREQEIPFQLGENMCYKFVTIGSVKFCSKMYKEISTVDYFVKLQNNEVGAIIYYFVDNYKINAYIDIYKVVDTCDHFLSIKIDGRRIIIDIKEIIEKMIYIKIGNQEIVTSIPNKYEKT